MIIKIRNLLIIILLVAAIACPLSIAQINKKTIIAVVKSQNSAWYDNFIVGFKEVINKRGIDFDILEFDLQKKDNKIVAHMDTFNNINKAKPDFILTIGGPATKISQDIIKDTPIIFSMILSPEKQGVSVSGVSLDIPYDVRVAKLKDIIPNMKKIGLIYTDLSVNEYEGLLKSCQVYGLNLAAIKINTEREFPEALNTLYKENISCFFMIPDPKVYFQKSIEFLFTDCIKKRIPVVGLSSFYTRAGALISFDCDYEDIGKQTADYLLGNIIDKSRPVHIIPPRKIKFSLNLNVAKMINVDIDNDLTREASEVFGQ